MGFKEIYKAPFFADPYGMYIFGTDDPKDKSVVTALDITEWSERGEKMMKDLARLLNGEKVDTIFEPVSCEHDIITLSIGTQIRVRGWGFMSSRHNLDNEEMCKIQDNFAKWVAYKMMENDKININ